MRLLVEKGGVALVGAAGVWILRMRDCGLPWGCCRNVQETGKRRFRGLFGLAGRGLRARGWGIAVYDVSFFFFHDFMSSYGRSFLPCFARFILESFDRSFFPILLDARSEREIVLCREWQDRSPSQLGGYH